MGNSGPDSFDTSNIFRLDGRVAFISGATGLLGRPMATALASAGAHVIVNSRRREAVEEFVRELTDQQLQASAASFDITDGAAVQEHFSLIATEHGRLDVLVNNASSGLPGTIETATLSEFDQLYRVNVVASFCLIKTALPLLKEAGRRTEGGASVVNIASMYGTVSPDPSVYGSSGADSPPYYGAAKGGLIQLTRYAACHLAPHRIRVNCISPGPFPASQYLARDSQFYERLCAKVPMKRTGSPHEIQGPLLFLASDASSFVTGANLPVDGGWTSW